MKKLNCSPLTLLRFDFGVASPGYDPDVVDELLDQVIEDYELFHASIAQLQRDNALLVAETEKLRLQVTQASIIAREQSRMPSDSEGNNLELVRKISFLEQRCRQLEEELKARS